MKIEDFESLLFEYLENPDDLELKTDVMRLVENNPKMKQHMDELSALRDVISKADVESPLPKDFTASVMAEIEGTRMLPLIWFKAQPLLKYAASIAIILGIGIFGFRQLMQRYLPDLGKLAQYETGLGDLIVEISISHPKIFAEAVNLTEDEDALFIELAKNHEFTESELLEIIDSVSLEK